MDPKKTATLDPKLQETYNRVMGIPLGSAPVKPAATPAPTATSSAQSTPAPTASTAPSATIPPQTMPSVPKPTSPNPPSSVVMTPSNTASSSPPAQPTASVKEPVTQTNAKSHITTFVASSTPAKAAEKNAENKKISPAILLLGVVVFFVVYALFWVKLFNLPLPFLPQ